MTLVLVTAVAIRGPALVMGGVLPSRPLPLVRLVLAAVVTLRHDAVSLVVLGLFVQAPDFGFELLESSVRRLEFATVGVGHTLLRPIAAVFVAMLAVLFVAMVGLVTVMAARGFARGGDEDRGKSDAQ